MSPRRPNVPGGVGVIGPRLRLLRHERGLKAREVAARSGLSPSQLSKLESGRHEPQWATVVRIYRALGFALREEATEYNADNQAA